MIWNNILANIFNIVWWASLAEINTTIVSVSTQPVISFSNYLLEEWTSTSNNIQKQCLMMYIGILAFFSNAEYYYL